MNWRFRGRADLGLLIAAVIAYCNAVASAQLAAAYPTSGGTYIYGRERLGHWWGFIAGWGFVVGISFRWVRPMMTPPATPRSAWNRVAALANPLWAEDHR